MTEKSFRNSLYDQIYQESIGPDIKTFKNLFPNKYKLSKSFFDYETEIVLQPGPKNKYGAGVLFPQRSIIDSNETQEDVSSSDENEDEIKYGREDVVNNDNSFEIEDNENEKVETESAEDTNISLANQYLPSSLGLTVITDFSDDIEVIADEISVYKKIDNIEDEIIELLFLEVIYTNQSLNIYEEFSLDRNIYYEDLGIDENNFGNIINPIRKICKQDINDKTDKRLLSLFNKVSSLDKNKIQELLNNLQDLYKSMPSDEKFSKNISGYVRYKRNLSYILRADELSNKKNFKIDHLFEDDKIKIHIEGRTYKSHKGLFFITTSLINNIQKEQAPGEKPKIDNQECIFQANLRINSLNNKNCFISFKSDFETILNQEDNFKREKYHDLIYDLYNSNFLNRDKKNFAIGHGCACSWNDPVKSLCNSVYTVSMPKHYTHPVEPNEAIELSMFKLSKDENYISNQVNLLISNYDDWIIKTSAEQENMSESENFFFLRNLEQCKNIKRRIKEGLSLISRDSNIFSPHCLKAFQLMNQSMIMQQCHYHIVENGFNGKKNIWDKDNFKYSEENFQIDIPNYEDYAANIKRGLWRPFQLAFILINLKSIIDKDDPSRNIVDLLWFPTGGGKTEAYLGLSAFTIFYNKIINSKSFGNYILMRYTLRLLTGQQFQRAQSLICSMEKIRRGNLSLLGEKEISIGLFVGNNSSPNTKERWRSIKNEIRENGKRTNLVLLNCPWCGTEMGPLQKNEEDLTTKGYGDDGDYYCENAKCDFHEGLPVYTVDEVLYTQKPSLIIATVDKFAITPWKYKEVKKLFFNKKNPNQIKPQLIIQDELHLISGKLGSMVGFFELMIEKLCEDVINQKSIKPKIIASTATISNSQNQIRSLYGRQSNLFPPQLSKMGNSFFAEVKEEKKGRMYVGIFFSANSSQQITLSRLTAYIAQEPKLHLFNEGDPHIADMYWTSVLYFNSTRELNQANTLIENNIRNTLRRYYDRLNISSKNEEKKHIRRYLYSDKGKVELTSRETESNLTKYFQRLQQNKIIGIDDKEVKMSGGSVVDICLATNMIQVGIDISRLNIMIINGQPKTTSEYIQASSRVGRSKSDLGLVFTIYNTSKSRDRSHFERFDHYHSSIYSYVEPTSVTPFSKNLLERALHSLILTLVKLIGDESLEDKPSIKLVDEELTTKVKSIVLERFKICEPEYYENEKYEIEELIDNFFQKWKSLEPEIYGYMDITKLNQKKPLLKPFNTSLDENWDDAIETLTNMRTVDGQGQVRINRIVKQ